jgi:hypothetical protein
MPLIRDLCAVVPPVPALAPHIYTGIESIIAESAPKSTPAHRAAPKRAPTIDPSDLVLLAIAATYLARTYDQLESDDSLDELVATAPALLTKHSAPEPDDLAEEVAGVLGRADEEEWTSMAWYTNMQSVLGQNTTNGHILDDQDDESGDDLNQVRVGGGEMAMYAEDWGSEKRKREYQTWERGIRERIKNMRKVV